MHHYDLYMHITIKLQNTLLNILNEGVVLSFNVQYIYDIGIAF